MTVVRSIVVNLSADVTNFRMQLRAAQDDLSNATSTFNNNLKRIRTESDLLTAQLGNTGTAFQKLSIQIKAQQQAFTQQSIMTDAIVQKFNRLAPTLNATSAEYRNLELKMWQATAAEQTLANNLELLNRELRMVGHTEGISKVASQITLAGVSTQQLVANLGSSARQIDVYNAKLAGLGSELVLNRKQQSELSAALATANTLYPVGSAEIQKYTLELVQARLAGTNLRNSINDLKRDIQMSSSIEGVARLNTQIQSAGISTQQLVANLGAGASQIDVYRAKIVGLTVELGLNQQLQSQLTATVALANAVYGQGSMQVQKYSLDLAAAKLAGSNIANSIQQMNLGIVEVGRNNAANQLADKFKLLRNDVSLAELKIRELVYSLGPAATEMAKLEAKIAGSSAVLAAMAREITALSQNLRLLMADERSTATAISEAELALKKAKVEMSAYRMGTEELRISLARLRAEATQAPIMSNLSRLKFDMEMAGLATRQTTLSFADNASAISRTRAQFGALQTELTATRSYARSLATEFNNLSRVEGNNVERLMQLERELRTTRIRISELTNEIRGLEEVSNNAGRALSLINSAALSVGLMFTTMVTYPIIRATSAGLDFNAMIESSTTQFRVLYDSISEAMDLMTKIQTFAKLTPFETEDITKQATILGQFGVSLRNIMPMMQILGDISGGNKERFAVIAYNFAQITALGKLTGRDVMSIAQQGFSVPKWIARLRISKGDKGTEASIINAITKPGGEMEQAAVSAREVAEAMKFATSEGQTFFDMMKEKSKTYEGQMSTLRDNWKMMVGAITKPLFNKMAGTILPAINNLMNFLRVAFEINPVFSGIILTVGGIAAAIGPCLIALYGLIKVVGWAKDAYVILGTKATEWLTAIRALTWSTALSSLAMPLAVAAGIALIGAEIYVLTRNAQEYTDWVNATFDTLEKAFEALKAKIHEFIVEAKNAVPFLKLFTEAKVPKFEPKKTEPLKPEVELRKLAKPEGTITEKDFKIAELKNKLLELEKIKSNMQSQKPLLSDAVIAPPAKAAKAWGELNTEIEATQKELYKLTGTVVEIPVKITEMPDTIQALKDRLMELEKPVEMAFDTTTDFDNAGKNLREILAIRKKLNELENVKELEKFGVPLTDVEQAQKDSKKAVDSLNEAKNKRASAWGTLIESISKNFGVDLQKLKDAFKIAEIDLGKTDLDLSGFTSGAEDATKKLEEVTRKMESFVDKIVNQAKKFADAIGLFDKALVDKISPERLYVRLQETVKMMTQWKDRMVSLRQKLGSESALYQEVLAMGPTPKGAGLARALDKMDKFMLGATEALRNEQFNLGLAPAGEVVRYGEEQTKKVENIVNINVNGGVIIDNMETLVERITAQLWRKGTSR